jgi:hypothetical protein
MSTWREAVAAEQTASRRRFDKVTRQVKPFFAASYCNHNR